jgi:Ni,Fe-hydrogenase maturation factor
MLLGVEVERVSVGVGLSSVVEQAIDAAVEQLPRLCRSLLAAPATG